MSEKIHPRPKGAARHLAMRVDLSRDTEIFACPNIDGWPHVTIGGSVTLIIHPHAARRLIADIQAVLDGKDFSAS